MSDTPESIREPVPAPYSIPAEESFPNFQEKKIKDWDAIEDSHCQVPKSSNKKTINKPEERRQSKQSNSPRLEEAYLSLAKDKDLG